VVDVGVHDAIDALFADNGPIARRLSGYRPRQQQIEMAHAVADALKTNGARVCIEAGTGTGKSLAYLAAALLSGKRVLVTTGTKALQDQLFFKDVPLALDAVADLTGEAPGKDPVVVMKGRQTYLCKLRFEQFAAQPLFQFAAEAKAFQQIVTWAKTTTTGDRTEIDLPEPYSTWSDLDAGSETCIGQRCPQFDPCFVTVMRRRAEGARLLIANHHLLCADLRVRTETRGGEDGFARVIPDVDAIVLDEAHALPDVASDYFGVQTSSVAIARVIGAARLIAEGLGGDDRAAVLEALIGAEEKCNALFARLRSEDVRERSKLSHVPEPERDAAIGALRMISKSLSSVPDERLVSLKKDGVDAAIKAAERNNAVERVDSAADAMAFVLSKAVEDPGFVVMSEPARRGAAVTAAPVDVATALAGSLFHTQRPIVMTSATLAVAGDTTVFAARVGLKESTGRVFASPFDYARRAALYCPKDMPDPRAPAWNARFLEEASFLLELSRGGALLLFTSHAALQEGFAALAPVAARCGVALFKQGDAPKHKLLDELRARDGAIGGALCATRSFWEGVDVRGRALRLVVVDRLPFEVPSDPLVRARAELCKARGGDPFLDITVPQAALALKQGAGRLLRDVDDAGVVAVLDGRLRSRPYGRLFLDSMPAMTRIGARGALADFWRRFVEPALGLKESA
jgi:ATP-dependent DNA helicase DinG